MEWSAGYDGSRPISDIHGLEFVALKSPVRPEPSWLASARHRLPTQLRVGLSRGRMKILCAEELDDAWRGGRAHLAVDIQWNARPVGHINGGAEMSLHFGQLIAHLTKTRRLRAACILGSGTLSQRDTASGFGCIIEPRASCSSTASRAPPTWPSATGCALRVSLPKATASSTRSISESRSGAVSAARRTMPAADREGPT